jgi:hypothetical protein
MPDLTLCNNQGCPLKDDCYRYRALPNPKHQSYTRFEWMDKEMPSCDQFMCIRPNDKVKPLGE